MSQSISPYALLCASKPKPALTVVTPYDLYSAVQSAAPSTPQPEPAQETHSQILSPAATMPYSGSRTHYISSIHARHNQAARRTSFSENRP